MKLTKARSSSVIATWQRRFLVIASITLIFVASGLYLLQPSRAATFATAAEAESGTRSGGASTVSDSGASGGTAVRFAGGSGGPGLITPPANPSLSTQGRKVLAYLQNLEGKGMLAGQQETDQCTTCESTRMKSITGKEPALHGHETGDYATDPMGQAVTDWNTKRQITTFSWHIGAPPSNDLNWMNSQGNANIDRVLQSGTNENTVYMAKLDKMANRLQAIENANVPILWRPFHEMNGGWFWWSKSGSEAYKRLWVHMFNYFTNTKDLDNLIWVWSAAENQLPNGAWYPGNQYVDILGSDTYNGNSNATNWTNHYNGHKQIAPTKPSALTETDYMPNPNDFISRNNKMIWFLPWYGQWVDKNSSSFKSQVYNHSYTITADEMPDLR